jgi:hypothetical protein
MATSLCPRFPDTFCQWEERPCSNAGDVSQTKVPDQSRTRGAVYVCAVRLLTRPVLGLPSAMMQLQWKRNTYITAMGGEVGSHAAPPADTKE